MKTRYEMVVGLEVHAELRTQTKIFCGCATAFGATPNSQCCPVCMGLPGALPMLNRRVVEYAVKAGLATDCRIAHHSHLDRKHYFYPDLPKAYQISQYDRPLCEDGHLEIETDRGARRIRIARIHIEEDAGKLLHDPKRGTLIDLNRSGVPLIEIVSAPDLRSSEEARAYLMKLRSILVCAGVSDGRMNEGSLRCDVNLSVRPAGDEALHTRTETKNLNSFQAVVRAIEGEFQRQVALLRAGGAVRQETRRYDAQRNQSTPMRDKENADDYRYFPDPDLPPIELTEAQIERWRKELPELPEARKRRYMAQHALSAPDCEALVAQEARWRLFEAALPFTKHAKALCNLIVQALSASETEEAPFPPNPTALARLATLRAEGRLNAGAAREVLRRMLAEGRAPEEIIAQARLDQVGDERALARWVDEVLAAHPELIAAHRAGKYAVINRLLGQIMRASGGRADPEAARALLEARLRA